MDALDIAIALIKRFEGFYPHPYLDPVGIPTIGYGTIRYPDRRAVSMSDPPVTKEQAEAVLRHHLMVDVVPAVARLCPELDTPARVAAILDWTYNLGAGNLRASTMRRRINEREWPAVPGEVRRWNRAGGLVLRGLVLRREAEAVLI